MSPYLRAVALDYDGTLTEGGPPAQRVLSAIGTTRERGQRAVLVTGRILGELTAEFPDVADHFDAIVAENGAVVVTSEDRRRLASPVDPDLARALARRGLRFREGEVLLAGSASDELAALDEVRQLGLDEQLVRNRGELMILPPGVSKGAGLFDALGELGVSYHSTIAAGDAENDHALLASCEVGAAVANAVPALRRRADVVLRRPNGSGVAELLTGPVLSGHERVHARRWYVRLGRGSRTRAVELPGSQINVAIVGGSAEGKSYVAGLLAERVMATGYVALVVDAAGDHVDLRRLRGVVRLEGEEAALSADRARRLFGHRFASIVADLSPLAPSRRNAVVADTPALVEASRDAAGLPHWVIVDGAGEETLAAAPPLGEADPPVHGYCIVSRYPRALGAATRAGLDVVIATPGDDVEDAADLAGEVAGMPAAAIAGMLAAGRPGEAVFARRPSLGPTDLVSVSDRVTRHVRHWQTATRATLPPDRRFHFRSRPGAAPIHEAANLTDFCSALEAVDAATLRRHAREGDFSRWVTRAIDDRRLGEELAAIERDTDDGATDELRHRLLSAVRGRYWP